MVFLGLFLTKSFVNYFLVLREGRNNIQANEVRTLLGNNAFAGIRRSSHDHAEEHEVL